MLAITRRDFVVMALLVLATTTSYAERLFDIDTYLAMKSVYGISVSPDTEFLVYNVSENDLDEDNSRSSIWMKPLPDGEPVRISGKEGSSWSPQWSPDNRYLAIMSSRNDSGSQVWLLDRRGGDAQQLTDIEQGVRSYKWSPDGTQMLLLVRDPEPAAPEEGKSPHPKPYVIDRLQFKRDYTGYLDDRRTHVYVFDISTGDVRQVTFGDYDDSQPTWSPDGKDIVFVSNRTEWPDTNRNTDLWRVDVTTEKPEAERLTDSPYGDSGPVYSPDGRYIAYRSKISDNLPVYAIPQLVILDLETGKSTPVEALAEVQPSGLRFSADGQSLLAIIQYRGERQLVSIDVASGIVKRIISGENIVREFDVTKNGDIYARITRPHSPSEIFHLGESGLEQISAINTDLLADVNLGTVEKHTYTAQDGATLETFITFPPGYEKGKRYPAMLHTHGGPWAQWDWSFDYESQLFAAQGYVVVMPNFRGSWGYGQAFTDALIGGWGVVDYQDSMDAVDFAIGEGWVDGDRMATYGWSWGGYLTNHIITKTDRFKAAISGASETLMVVNYGHDEWQRLWDEELGFPWLEENREKWDAVSPFYSLDKVTTPTLVVCGEDDWNMPVINSEQLYMVLRRQGIPTQLIVYPGQHHGISVPSYQRHMYEHYFDWLDRYVTK